MKKNVLKIPKRDKTGNLADTFNNVSGQEEEIKLISFEELISNKNPYPLSNLEELIESIKQFGVEQSLLVQKQEKNKYIIIAGHRRYSAVKYILENENNNNEYEDLEQLYCKVVDEKEDETLVRIRLHETNLQARPLNKMSEEEKNIIVTEYLKLINDAREKGLMIKGKEVKGKTRDILANMLGIASSTAGKLIKETKGADFGTPPEKEEELKEKDRIKTNNTLIKSLQKSVSNEYLDKELIQQINEIVKEYNEKQKNKVDKDQLSLYDE